MSEAPARIAETRSGRVEFRLLGGGPTVLVLHGGHSSCRESFGVAALLESGFSVLVPSRPGYGATPAATGETAEQSAAAMVGLLDFLGVEKVSVVAVSAGGPTGIHLAARFPQRVRCLVLESAVTTTWLTPADELYRTARVMFHPRIEWLTWFMVRTMSNLFPVLIARQMIPSFSKLPARDVAARLSPAEVEAIRAMNNRQRSGRGFMLDIEHRVGSDVLGRIAVPTLVVHSPHDNSVPFEHAQHAHRLIPDSRLFAAPAWGHLVWIGKGADEVDRRVVGFLREH